MNSPSNIGRSTEAPADKPTPRFDEKKKETPPRGHREVGGPPGPEPTRYGDWEKGGRCIDF